MKYFKVATLAISLFLCFMPLDVGAVEVAAPPVGQVKTDSPILVTGYGFSGPRLHYVQLFNSSNEVGSITNWSVEYTISGQPTSIEIGKLKWRYKAWRVHSSRGENRYSSGRF